jgi:2-oxoglutarate ferredoxin oxidoreductase subunit beta
LSSLDGVALATRVTVDKPANVRKAAKAIRKAFEYQTKGLGFTIVEVIATCPTNWGMTPVAAFEWMRENMLAYYPLGTYKDCMAEQAGE